jgi:hypothetical protein
MKKSVIMLIILLLTSLILGCKIKENITITDSAQNIEVDFSNLTKNAKKFTEFAAMLDGFATDYETYEKNIKPIVEESLYEKYVNIELMPFKDVDGSEQYYSYCNLKGLSKERLNEISKLVQKHSVEKWQYYDLKMHFYYSKPYEKGDYSYVFCKSILERLTGNIDKPEKSGCEYMFVFIFKKIDERKLIVDDSASIDDIDFKIDEKDIEYVEELKFEIDYRDFNNNFFE